MMTARATRTDVLVATGLSLATVMSFVLPLVASAENMSDEELAKKLHLKAGQQIIRKNGKRMLLSPLDDDTVKKLLQMREMLDKREKLEAGVPRLDPAHRDSVEIYRQGRELMNKEDFAGAVKLFSQFLDKFISESKSIEGEKQPQHDYYLSWGYQNRGFCYLRQHKLDLGVKDLTEAIKLRPRYAQNYANRAKAYRMMGNLKAAQEDEAKLQSLPATTGDVEVDLSHEFPKAGGKASDKNADNPSGKPSDKATEKTAGKTAVKASPAAVPASSK